MLIKVMTLTGKVLELRVEPSDKVIEIKEQIEEKEGIPPAQQRLIFRGKQLSDDLTAEFYKLNGGDIVHMVLALRGGKSNKKNNKTIIK